MLPTIILDIDHTLLNTDKIKRDLARLGEDLNITPKMFWRAYRILRKKGEFSINKIIRYFPKMTLACRCEIKKLYRKVFKNSQKYLYHDAKYFLQWASHKNFKIILYTFGNREVHQYKIKALKKSYKIYASYITHDPTKRLGIARVLPKKGKWVWLDDFKDVRVSARILARGRFFCLKRKKRSFVPKNIPAIKSLYPVIRFLASQ